MFLVAAAMVSAWLITVADLPGKVVGMLEPFLGSPIMLMVMIMVLVMIVGHGDGHDADDPDPDPGADAGGAWRPASTRSTSGSCSS